MRVLWVRVGLRVGARAGQMGAHHVGLVEQLEISVLHDQLALLLILLLLLLGVVAPIELLGPAPLVRVRRQLERLRFFRLLV